MRTKLLTLLVCLGTYASAQHWIFFKDKCSANTPYFETAVCQSYIDQLSSNGMEVLGQSKWLNAAVVANPDIEKLSQLNFVTGTKTFLKRKFIGQAITEEFNYGQSDWQVEMIGLDSLHRMGYTGKGVLMGVFDGGFTNMDSMSAFDSLWLRDQVIATKDFQSYQAVSFDKSTHGMRVMGLIAGQEDDSIFGASPDAHFVLARTEIGGSETHQEEFNWIAGMEWADSIGVDIIHSSLGYSEFDSLQGDYSYADMDGSSTIVTIAAEVAASRGIFITNSAGNQGNDPWYYITAPCDGEHVLCVGAVDSFRNKPQFSSYGPSADGRVKPDLMAMGHRNTILNPDGTLRTGSGTSFSGPLIAGAVACLMQAHPDRSNEAIFQALLMSCDRYSDPDSAYGHGIPDLVKADSILTSFVHVKTQTPFAVAVYPNPTHDKLNVVCSPNSVYTLFDHQGKVAQTGKFLNLINFLNISELAKGNYVLALRYNKQLVHHKIVKQ